MILFYNYLYFLGILCGKLIWSLFPFTMIHKTFWFEMWKCSAHGYFKLNVIGCKLFHEVLKLMAVDKCENSYRRINFFESCNITFNTQNFCNKEIEKWVKELIFCMCHFLNQEFESTIMAFWQILLCKSVYIYIYLIDSL